MESTPVNDVPPSDKRFRKNSYPEKFLIKFHLVACGWRMERWRPNSWWYPEVSVRSSGHHQWQQSQGRGLPLPLPKNRIPNTTRERNEIQSFYYVRLSTFDRCRQVYFYSGNYINDISMSMFCGFAFFRRYVARYVRHGFSIFLMRARSK